MIARRKLALAGIASLAVVSAGAIAWHTTRAPAAQPATAGTAPAERLLERLGKDLGQVDQALRRVAAARPAGSGAVRPEEIDDMAGSAQERSAWGMIDDAAAGDAPRALSALADLIAAGESPAASGPSRTGSASRKSPVERPWR